MINRFKTVLFMFVITCSFAGCNKEKVDKVNISVHFQRLKNVKVQAFTTDLVNLNPILLSKSTLDSAGNAVLKIDIDQPLFGYVKVGEESAQIFIRPGDNLKIAIDNNQKGNKINHYEGDAAGINQFISDLWLLRIKYETLNDKFYFQLEPNEFLILKDSLNQKYVELFDTFKSEFHPDKETVQLLKSRQDMSILFFTKNYALSKFTYDINTDAVPATLRSAVKALPYDSLALKYNMPEYGIVVDLFMKSSFYPPLNEEAKDIKPDSAARLFPLLTQNKINASAYPRDLKDFLSAKNLDYLLVYYGINSGMETIYKNFRRDVKNEKYLTSLRKSFGKWEAIGKGKTAPDFTGQTIDGKKISLSDLKGKIIFMDVWATWCGPCREEFPYTRKIQKDFEGNDNVTFLFVSVDRDIAAWQKMVKSDNFLKGVHINQQQNQQPGAIWESYLISGIPRYVLIDADGKFVEASASYPSSGEVTGKIRQLLNTQKLEAK